MGDLARLPFKKETLFHFLYIPKDKFLVDCFNRVRTFWLFLFFLFFSPLAAVVVEERFSGFNCISFIRGSEGPSPENLGKLECRNSHLPHFLGLFFIFLFFVNQFSLFFSAVL